MGEVDFSYGPLKAVIPADAVPFSATELGVSVQVESEGAPLQVRFTVWPRQV